jgi:hypothetical protein
MSIVPALRVILENPDYTIARIRIPSHELESN